LNWAIFEEILATNITQSRKIYYDLIKIIPHRNFTFSRVWILAAFFEVRHGDIETARKIFGMSIGTSPRSSVFSAYIEMEYLLGDYERVRKIYSKYILTLPHDIRSWISFAQFESKEGNIEYARNIFEEAINKKDVENMILLWAVYIDFETKVGSKENVEILYSRCLEDFPIFSFWRGKILFETEINHNENFGRELFQEAEISLFGDDLERKKLREFRVEFEDRFGTNEAKEEATQKLPSYSDSESKWIFPEDVEDSLARLIEIADEWEKNEGKK
jgi:crooked neck